MPQVKIDVSSSGDNVVVNRATADRTNVLDYALIAAGAVTVILKDEAGTEFAKYTFGAADAGVIAPPLGAGEQRFQAKGDIIINLSGAVGVTGHLSYRNNK